MLHHITNLLLQRGMKYSLNLLHTRELIIRYLESPTESREALTELVYMKYYSNRFKTSRAKVERSIKHAIVSTGYVGGVRMFVSEIAEEVRGMVA